MTWLTRIGWPAAVVAVLAASGRIAAASTPPGGTAPSLPPSYVFDELDIGVGPNYYNTIAGSSSAYGTYSFSGPLTGGSGSIDVSSTFTRGFDPSVSGTVTVNVLSPTATPYVYGLANLGLVYSFEIAGPSDVAVPVDFAGSTSIAWSSGPSYYGVGWPDMVVEDPNYNQVGNWQQFLSFNDGTDGASGDSTQPFAGTLDLNTNEVYTVYLDTQTTIFGSYPPDDVVLPDGTYTATVSIDPTITIDSSFNLSGYNVDFSPDLAGGAGVPDAAVTLELLVSAFVFLTAFKRLYATDIPRRSWR